MTAKGFMSIQFRDSSTDKKRKSHWILIFLLLINVIVIKYVTETLILLLLVEIGDIRV